MRRVAVVVLAAISGYTVFVIVRAVVYAAEGRSGRHDAIFWGAIVLLGVIAVATGRVAAYLWRKPPDQPSSASP